MGSFLLTLPLAMLISNPIVWILMGIVLTATYKMVIEPLFYLVKDYVDEKGTVKEEKSPKEQKFTRSKSLNSGLDTISRQTNDSDKRVRRNSYSPSTDSGIVPGSEPASSKNSRRNSNASGDSGLGGKEFHENLDTLVHQTNRKDYTYWLQQHDIAHIARIKYGYSEGSTNGVFFCIPGNLESLSERLREYKNKAERKNSKRIFTSVINLGGNHWVTLVVAYDSNNKQFRAYYCDSFSTKLPSPGSKRSSIGLANEIKNKLVAPLTDQASKLNAQGKKEMGEDVQKTAQTCRDKKNELVNVPIDTDNMVSALEEILGIGSDNIRSSPAKQQNDSCNCGIFALENAHRITQMFNEGKSFEDIDKKLSEYKFDLNEKRREFAEALMKDEEWREHLENGLLCDLPPGTDTSLTSRVQNTAQVAI